MTRVNRETEVKRFPVHSKYKSTPIPWLPNIPNHWGILPNGRLFQQRNQVNAPELPILEVSINTGVTVRDFKNSNRKQKMTDQSLYKVAHQGDIAYNMMRMWQGAVGVAPVDGLISPAYVVAQPNSINDSRFYAYLFRTKAYMNEVNKYSHGIVEDRNRLYWSEFKQMPSPQPPETEQTYIAEFLDHKTTQIKEFIGRKEQLIKLLQEQKTAIINKAVTKGIDPDVRLKPSGLDWLGDIPEHWEVKKLKYYVKHIAEQVTTKGQDDIYVSLEKIESWTGQLNLIDGNEEFESQVKKFQEGDILFGRLRPYLAKVILAPQKGVCVGELLVLRSNQPEYSAYLHNMLLSKDIIGLIDSSTFGAKMPRASWNFIGNIQIPFPKSNNERQEINNFISSVTFRVNRIITKANQEINLIKEYGESLVADAVTGKIDVRTWQGYQKEITV